MGQLANRCALRVWLIAALTGAVGATVILGRGAQTATFRAAVDLVAVDVQVVDRDGRPVPALSPGDFEVSINGRRRRIVSADYVQFASPSGEPFRPTPAGPRASNRSAQQATDGARVYILAFDVGTLGVGDSRALVESALTFIDRLEPTDLVGLHSIPVGPHLPPTSDHRAVRLMVQRVVGSRTNSEGAESRFNLSASEIIDIMAESVRATPFANIGRGARGTVIWEDAPVTGDEVDTIRAVMMRECGASEMRCGDEIRAEATSRAFMMQAHALQNISGLRTLIRQLGAYQGRKTVVLFSSGMPTTDRPGGAPDLGTLPQALGRDAAATGTTIYTLHVDRGLSRGLGAGGGRASGSASTRSRDRAVEGQGLEAFADASGGALFAVNTGAGEQALQRVLRETSSFYLLGVEPQASDRDGSLRRLSVKVKRDRVTVRSRQWVVVPAGPQPPS